MRKLLITFSLFLLVLLAARGQSNNAFTTVTVVNGKVVFEQFIPIIPSEKSMSTDQRYIQLQNWAKKTFAGNPLLGGIRYDEKARTVTVSNRSEIGRPEKMVMSYRFDVSVNNERCILNRLPEHTGENLFIYVKNGSAKITNMVIMKI